MDKFRAPSRFEHWFNALVAGLARIGISLPDGYRLLVVGRKSGKEFAIAVTVLTMGGEKYLVAPRGETQWVRNVRVANEVALQRGNKVQRFRASEINGELKHVVLATYLDKYRKAVQRYFPLPAGTHPKAFADVAESFPAFRLDPTFN